MNPVYAAALELQGFCRQRGWRFSFIGGIAVQRWGEPRLTVDADLTLLTGFGGEELYVDALLQSFRPRTPEAREFALKRRVLLIEASNTISLDVSLGAIPFEERVVQRSSEFLIQGGESLVTCCAEDLLVLKTVAGRDQDWADIRGVAARQTGRLDVALIEWELLPLLELKQDEAAAERLRQVLRA
ncbi:MAG TPA: hypothetical protein VFM88_08825 [Vicinamibacteria bacterium]|nr:hypothetical protein [Vicinamibacteria bacterium]